MSVADLLATDGPGLVPLAVAIVLALGALWEPGAGEPAARESADTVGRNPPTCPDGSPLASR